MLFLQSRSWRKRKASVPSAEVGNTGLAVTQGEATFSVEETCSKEPLKRLQKEEQWLGLCLALPPWHPAFAASQFSFHN